MSIFGSPLNHIDFLFQTVTIMQSIKKIVSFMTSIILSLISLKGRIINAYTNAQNCTYEKMMHLAQILIFRRDTSTRAVINLLITKMNE